MILLAPLMIAIGAAIVVESGRPIFFSQTRLGQAGRHFRIYKFRKFHERLRTVNAPLTMENDRRCTAVGRVLARTKFDELPQLWNVLKGDMSVVGPRPESLAFEDCFDGPYWAVLDYVPGIFGPSQVVFRNEAALYRGRPDPIRFYRDVLFPLKAEIDLAYFSQRTLVGDLRWALRGVLAVFSGIPAEASARVLVTAIEHRSDSNPATKQLAIPCGTDRARELEQRFRQVEDAEWSARQSASARAVEVSDVAD